MTSTRWAILGLGNFADGTAPTLAAADGCEITCVASRSRDRALEFVRRHELPAAAAATYDEALERDDVDAVYLVVPNHLHVALAGRALAAGKHVLSEKPLTPFRAHAERVFAAAERAGRLLAEGFMYLHHPQTARLRAVCRGGGGDLVGGDPGSPLLGRITAVIANRGYDLTRPDIAKTRFSHRMWGGALMDLGCYPVSLVRELLGEEPDDAGAVAAIAPPLETESLGVDSVLAYHMRFPSGAVASGVASAVSRHAGNSLTIVGEWGRLTTGWAYVPHREPDGPVLELDQSHPEGKARGPEKQTLTFDDQSVSGAQREFENFARAARGETGTPIPSPEWSIAQAGVIESLLADAGVRFDPASPDAELRG